MIPWFREGKYGWLLVALVILGVDILAEEEQQLTDSFRRGLKDPRTAALVTLVWCIVTAHLYQALPAKADPIHFIASLRSLRKELRHAVAA